MVSLNTVRVAEFASATPGRVGVDTDTLQPADFDQLAALVYQTSGITMPPAKRPMLEGRLRRRVRLLGLDSFSEYCAWLFDDANFAQEVPILINTVTTNKTDFFREPAHFSVLREVVLPRLVALRRRQLRVWTAACSTGPEAYSLAMVLDAFANDADGPEYGLLATDIDTDVLDVARRGVYPSDLLKPVPSLLRQRYVTASLDKRRNECRIVPDLREAIGFGQLNLVQRDYPVGEPMDIIFCRNVLIYFDKGTQIQIVSELVNNLRPGGYLFLAHCETALGAHPRLINVACGVFQAR